MTRRYPTLVVQFATREKVAEFRSGLGDAGGVVALGVDPAAFRTLAGLDALYLSITRAEQWGARPLPPHTATILRTTEADQREGMPKYILAGLVLRDGEPNTASFAVPLIVEALRRAVEEVNAKEPGAIRTLGLFEFELTFKDTPVQEVAASLAAATGR
jgi:hypothetical protein